MAVLWCGGEDIDFDNTAVGVTTTAGRFRSTYTRCALGLGSAGDNVYARGLTLGSAVTSCWFSCRFFIAGQSTNRPQIGLGKSGTSAGLMVGNSTSTGTRLGLYTVNGTSRTQLAEESGASLGGNILHRLDMQVSSYGASATVNVWLDSVLLITFTGDVTVGGLTNLDCALMRGNSLDAWNISEIIIADEDTRQFPGLATLALTGDGTTTDWIGVYSTINQTSFSDASPNYTNTTALDQQFNWTDLPSGSWVIRAVKITARMVKGGASPAVTQVKLGYNSGGTVAFGSGSTKALTGAYAGYDQLDLQNPVTTADWQQSEMNALQVDLQSLT